MLERELLVIKNVRCYLDSDGVVHLNLEDVARGLGFVEAKNGKEYVRWNRVNKYLADLSFATSGENVFIPENIFYKLCFKAENEVARAFQDMVTDEILPTIRKHGAYITPSTLDEMIASPEFGIQLLTALKSEREQKERLALEVSEKTRTIGKLAPKALFADAVSASNTTVLIGELAKILKQNGIDIGQNRSFEWLRNNNYLIKRKGTDYNMPTQYSMELGLFEIKETNVVHSDGHITINKTPKVTGRGQIYFVNKLLGKSV